MKIDKIYISGQITGIEKSEYELDFKRGEEIVRGIGCIPVNPLAICSNMVGATWIDCMLVCIAALHDCDSILMLNGWENGKGANIERYIAFQTNKKIIYEI